ncbi:MAG: extracellular solute-binding protein [Acidaminococcaceae bacterium]|nr:extracellular solute-binding protein [Acidaminococcaceae bacterium]
MLRKIFAVSLVLLSLVIAACGDAPEKKEQKNLVLYSQLEQEFTEALLNSYAEKNTGLKVSAIYEIKADSAKPDLILAERNVLLDLQGSGSLQAIVSDVGDMLPVKFKDDRGFWYGVFYDPTVFLINQQYARTVGQEQLLSWFDLEHSETGIRISMENLSSSDSSINFLTSLASSIGEDKTLSYLWNINRYIEQYAKFPFTPIRMAATGDADIAITKQSFVSKYLENNFPAYVIYPKEGTPINLYGSAVYKECKNVQEATKFINWLIADEAVKFVSQTIDTGYMFLLPQGIKGSAANPEILWLNTNYLKKEKQEALISNWLEKVRFNKNT